MIFYLQTCLRAISKNIIHIVEEEAEQQQQEKQNKNANMVLLPYNQVRLIKVFEV